MTTTPSFTGRVERVTARHNALIARTNQLDPEWDNGVFERWIHPVVTRGHVPLDWRYDFDPTSNPFFLERLGVNATLNPAAIYLDGKHLLVVRIEGVDRKSIFAVAESDNGVDNFRFWDEPLVLPDTNRQVTNIYDMRLTQHADGWIYGTFCIESKDPDAAPGDNSTAVAQCGIARTADLRTWERLPDIRTDAKQQRNVVLHPEFVEGKYAFYTRPQSSFMEGSDIGIGFSLCADVTVPDLEPAVVLDDKYYHSIKEVKSGPGATPIRTDRGWLHLCHGVRNTAAGMRYVLYVLVTDLADPTRVIARPGGHFLAPVGPERVGDVSNVVFVNGVTVDPDGDVRIYYASSDTRIHVATSAVDRLLDYAFGTPEDARRSADCTTQRLALIRHNRALPD